MMAAALILVAYLVGSLPFGYLIGRAKGVNLFRAGSGNIGATNAGRVLGRRVGVVVFVLDFLKGALPVALIVPVAKALNPGAEASLGNWDGWRVAAAAAAFLGHLFPVYLGFHGGKGVATGAGAVAVLVPGQAAVAVLTWLAAVLATRYVSAASMLAAVALSVARILSVSNPLSEANLAVTLFTLVGMLVVVVKHRGNLGRLWLGAENQTGKGAGKETALRAVHIAAVGTWFGAALFFNFVAAVPIFDSFKQVVETSPSDRTAYVLIVPDGTSAEKRADLASALAGAAVGPLFPRAAALSGLCVWLTFVSAWGWRNEPGRVNRWRLRLAGVASLLVAVSWPLSQHVSELRVLRFNPDASVAAAAKVAFGLWHLASLLMALITTVLAAVVLVMAGALRDRATIPPAAAA